MFRHVLVGVDGNDGGRDAIEFARMLREPGGEVTLAYIHNADPNTWRGSSPAYDLAERERAEELLEKARGQAGLSAQIRWRGSASVGRGLHELAEMVQADLLVIGSCRRSLFGRVLVGDDTRSALNGAPCAVAVASAGYAQLPTIMREIGVAYDGSPESEHALRVARVLADEHHSTLSAFEAVSLPAYSVPATAPPDPALITDLVNAARDRVAALDGVEPHAAYGQAAEELALYSASLDLLVVGSRGYGPIGRLVHGSTTQELARRSRCPLLVLTRGAREHPAVRDERPVQDAIATEA